MSRLKTVFKAQLRDLISCDWEPVQFTPDSMPACLSGIPADVFYTAYGSISPSQAAPYSSPAIPGGQLIGGIDVYRHSPDDPVLLNKDWYALVEPDDNSRVYLLDGPKKPHDHWLDHLPDRLENARLRAVPKRTEQVHPGVQSEGAPSD